MSQSSNDTFPTAMHIAAVEQIVHVLVPAVRARRDGLDAKAKAFADIVKIGRTHLMGRRAVDPGPGVLGVRRPALTPTSTASTDASPTSASWPSGTRAVGTGLNAPAQFGVNVAAKIAEITGLPFVSAPNNARCLPGMRDGGALPGRPGQPAGSGLHAHPPGLSASTPNWTRSFAMMPVGTLTVQRGEAARHLQGAAAAPRPAGVVRRGYEPLAAAGHAAGHAVAFRRGQAITVATRLPVGLRRRGGWQDTALPLPAGAWADLLTGAVYRGAAVPSTALTGRRPVALLVQEGE